MKTINADLKILYILFIRNMLYSLDSNYISAELELDIDTERFLK